MTNKAQNSDLDWSVGGAMKVRSSQNTRLGLGMLALLCAAPFLLAWDNTPNRKVRVSVIVILASETDDHVDKRLECIAREVRKMYPNLKGFRLGKMACKSLKIGDVSSFELTDDQKTSVTIQKAADKMDRIRLKINPPQMGEIIYSTPCGKFLPIMTPYRTKANEVLMIAIRVQPCNGK